MRKIFAAVAGVSMLGFAAGASASDLPSAEQAEEPILLSAMEMDEVTAGFLNLNINIPTAVNVATQTNTAVLSRAHQTNFADQDIKQTSWQFIRLRRW